MKITTQQIVNMLPFEAKDRLDILEMLEGNDPDKKFNIEQMLWDAYYAMLELKEEENFQKSMAKALKNEENLNKDLFPKIEKESEEELQKEVVEQSEKADLSEARAAMEKIIKEIRASKKVKLH